MQNSSDTKTYRKEQTMKNYNKTLKQQKQETRTRTARKRVTVKKSKKKQEQDTRTPTAKKRLAVKKKEEQQSRDVFWDETRRETKTIPTCNDETRYETQRLFRPTMKRRKTEDGIVWMLGLRGRDSA